MRVLGWYLLHFGLAHMPACSDRYSATRKLYVPATPTAASAASHPPPAVGQAAEQRHAEYYIDEHEGRQQNHAGPVRADLQQSAE